ncbi:DEAD/DEAH box helicase [Horticoccus luteus]|uniref:DEAD/DEAH box helicase n=1 Tax=Horticoccus luteus TaxID=2862869 RepID=A0A8F9TVY4_9BACT|nr:DEAD/DEAH box helicase [Horticoccus luteus]QYM78996.1 DEAD/DEAH box helicase [Horticoccus luteus]
MCAKFRSPAVRAVRTPEALKTLRAWLAELPEHARARGTVYFNDGRVRSLRAPADHYVEASVQGENRYTTTLFFTRGAWTSSCSCPVGAECKHAAAAALAWLAHVHSGAIDGADPTQLSRDAPPREAPPPPSLSFRQHWSPIIASQLGRALSASEATQLDELAALFDEFTQANGTLYPGALLRHGFDYTPPPGAPLYKPAFAGWWDANTGPADPWALWQYIAYDYERAGREIPEVFRPLTNTAAIGPAVSERLAQNELAAWQRALATEPPATETHPALVDISGLRARIHPSGGLVIEMRSGSSAAWRPPGRAWFETIGTARPVDFERLTPPEAALGLALAAECRAGFEIPGARRPLPAPVAGHLFRTRAARDAIVLPDGRPLLIEPAALALEARVSPGSSDRLDLRLVTPDGRDAARAVLLTVRPTPLYFFDQRVWHGPPPTPESALPKSALGHPKLMSRLRAVGLRLPPELEENVRRTVLLPHLRCWLAASPGDEDAMDFHAQLFARDPHSSLEQQWTRTGWQWTAQGTPPARRPNDPFLEFDLAAAQALTPRLADFQLEWHAWENDWARPTTKAFPEEFIAWHATLPPGVAVETSPGLATLLGPPLRAHIDFSAAPAPESAGRDWFNVTTKLRVQDTQLTPEEIALLLKARGKWVNLPRRGWQRLEVIADESATAALDRLGLDPVDVLHEGRPSVHRVHALQLAAEADALEARDARLAHALRERVHALTSTPTPALPAGLKATLRPYQAEGFHFLCHLSALGLGGVLADDMGLGKTVQTLAWLLHLAAAKTTADAPLRALVVCPKSVVHGWLAETARFAPALHATPLNPNRLGEQLTSAHAQLTVANYTQLRLHAGWFRTQNWDVVVLDEGQFIKNPGSQVASAARALPSRHRLVLTGTPIENRLTDLWSLFAFAQPGLLGTQSAFRRQHDQADSAALSRLHRRVRHFLLRRTKAQAAPDLPPRTEDDLIVELEGGQRRLYDAELKRARAHLLGVETDQALSRVRFNVLSSLLRLRQICCHPGLVDPAHRDLPSAKLDTLVEHLEELRDEGHQVLVFSQFVGMLEIIRDSLDRVGINHLMLTGATEDRGALVETFQTDKTKTVFLLSLKAAGFGLNLTAASYAFLYDPWWNPAAEAQAIDRTHRIGQTQPVVAYRLLAEDTVEQKIRLLQRDKAALASAVVQEESLASVLDLDTLRQVLA